MRAALVALIAVAAALPGDAVAEKPYNVLLLTFDTTRADFIGAYGREDATTPNLDRLAAEGVLFEYAFTSNPVTQPAHSTILTGVYPMVHGVRDNSMFKLPADRPTLATVLGEHGWATGAAIGGFPLVRAFGLSQGFSFYDDDITGNREDFRGRPAQRRGGTWYDERPAGHVNDAILPWLREHIDERFFVWLHYWDPHLPHTAPAPYGELYAHEPYLGEIAYADESLGKILAELERRGVYDRTIVIVTSDHGEGRLEHKEATHAFLAYGSTLHVPLIVKYPGAPAGRRVAQRAGTVDIVPTVIDLLDVDGPDDLQGRSLVSVMEDPDTPLEPPVDYYSESLSPRLSHGCGELRALYRGSLKYIHGPRPELFDLYEDPGELRDLSAERAGDFESMRAALETFVVEHASDAAASAAHEVDEETRARLEALGYLDAGGEGAEAVEETLRDDGAVPQDRVGDINLNSRLRQQLGAGQFGAARLTAERLVEAAPDNVFYRASLAQALVGLERIDEAATILEQAERLGGAHQEAFLGIAEKLFDAGEIERARALAAKVVADEDTAVGHVALARMARKAGDHQTFETEIDAAIAVDADHGGAYLERALARIEDERLDDAAADLRKALAVDPLSLPAQLAAANLVAARGDLEGALARVERALRLRPSFCEAKARRIELLVELERKDEAAAGGREMERTCQDDEWLEAARSALEGS